MSVLSGALAFGRAQADLLMTESVTVERAVSAVDPVTLVTGTTVTSHYEGKGRIKSLRLTVSEASASGQALASQDLSLHLPVGFAGDVATGDVVTVVTSDADPDLPGRKFRIRGMAQAGQVTAHRFPIEALS